MCARCSGHFVWRRSTLILKHFSSGKSRLPFAADWTYGSSDRSETRPSLPCNRLVLVPWDACACDRRYPSWFAGACGSLHISAADRPVSCTDVDDCRSGEILASPMDFVRYSDSCDCLLRLDCMGSGLVLARGRITMETHACRDWEQRDSA